MAFGIDDALAAGLKLVDKFVPDPEARAKAATELYQLFFQWDAAQMKVNEAEAASSNPWASGWRPNIGWACGTALWVQYVLYPLASWLFACFGHVLPPMPNIDEVLWQLMFGMLGMAGWRSLDKVKGLASK